MTQWNRVQAGKASRALHLFLSALGDNAGEVVLRAADDAEYIRRVAFYAANGGKEATTEYARAQSIMGSNFLGIEAATKHFDVVVDDRDFDAIGSIPWSAEMLSACSSTHILALVFPVSISEMVFRHEGLIKEDSRKDITESALLPGPQWHLVKKAPVENSIGKSAAEQRALLAKDEEVPDRQVLVYTSIGRFLTTKERLFSVAVRCGDTYGVGQHFSTVLEFEANGIRLAGGWPVEGSNPFWAGCSAKKKQK